jgi:hypothetical protein
MTEFDDRLKRAVERGHQRAVTRAHEAEHRALTEDELRQMHSRYRLQLSEVIEQRMRRLPEHFPGFQLQAVYGDEGWGVSCSRDDFVSQGAGARRNVFSRLQVTVRPFSGLHVLELNGKATIRNRETFNRTHFERLVEADPANFEQLLDGWIVEFAEMYAAGK